MKKAVHSYYVGIEIKLADMLNELYPLSPEFASYEDASTALEQLRQSYPDAQMCVWEDDYEMSDPAHLRDYRRHLQRLR